MSAPVEMRGVSYALDDGRVLVDDVSFEVGEGECLALIGRSGAGKTTALKLVNALLLPSAGTVHVGGRPTTDWDPIRLRRATGWVIQEIGLFPHLTVAENVGIVPELEGWDAPRRRARVGEMLELVALPGADYAARRPHQLSGGQRQRVGVARALAADPPLLLLDEPFGALDPVTRWELQAEFRALQRRLGKTALFVTHDLREAARVADRIALLAEGRLVFVGTMDELRGAAHPEARSFVEAAAAP